MRKLFFIFIYFAFSFSGFSQAENRRAVRVDFGGFIARPSNYGFGIGFFLEPKYLMQTNVSIGLKTELAALGRLRLNNSQQKEGSLAWVTSFVPVIDYYLNETRVRPSFGMGLGIYRLTSGSYSNGDWYPELTRGTKLGFSPRVGLDLGHFRLAADYNFIFGQRNIIDRQSLDLNSNYLSLKLGFFFGGGLRDI